MEPAAVLAIGLVVIALTVALNRLRPANRRGSGRAKPPAPPPTLPSPPRATSGPLVIRPSRLVVVGDLRPSTGLRQVETPAVVAGQADPRRLLLRDASILLFVAAAALLGLQALPAALGGRSGGVLSATATPRGAAGSPGGPAAVDAGSGGTIAPPGQAGTPNPAPATPVSGGASIAPPPAATPVSGGAAYAPDRLALLEPCPDRAGCYRYIVKRGDTLGRIARFFGVPLDTILRLNPQITDPSLILPGEPVELPGEPVEPPAPTR